MTTSTTKRRPGRRPNRRGEGSRLRDEIVQAATRLLQRGGTDETITLRAVAREAGIAAPSIYAHFPNPDAITASVVAEAFNALAACLRASREGVDDPVQRLFAQCYGYLRFAEEQPGLYRVVFTRARRIEEMEGTPAGSGQDSFDETLRNAVIEEAGTPAFAILVEAVTGCVEAGRSNSPDPFLASVALWSALHGYIGLLAAAPEFPWPGERAIVDAMITGLARILPA